ncbi:cupin domain-containing protein [Mesorhizobium sp. M1348]|uniref:cupin domain-containing protein n=1 Tax=unclassified Mesorhizobium TaxID=325217 RepID=UPI00333BE395
MSPKPTCHLIRPESSYEGKQGLSYFAGIAAETVGSSGICMHLLTMPPGARAKAHMHENHETAIYVLSGEVHTWYGERLEQHIVVKAGDLFYIPPGVPHLPANLSDSPASAVIARTDPNEQESVVLLPELDGLVA